MDSNNQHGGGNDELPKDDGSIEVISESGDSLSRNLDWSIYSAGRNSTAGSDVDSMDFQKFSMHSKMARIVHHDGRQYIESRDSDDGGLPYSAEFYVNDEMWKLNGEDCLLLSHRRYIAEVNVEGRINLDETINFEEVARTLIKHVKIKNVLRDLLLDECDKAKAVLQVILDELADEPMKTNEHKRDVMLLRILVQKHGNSLTRSFMNDLKNCASLSTETMTALDDYVSKTLKLIQRNQIICHSNYPLLSNNFINDAMQKALTIHRTRLAAICPSTLTDGFQKLHADSIMYVSMDDMKLFADLTTLDHPLLKNVLPFIFSKFVIKTQELSDNRTVDQTPMTNPIYLYISKSLLDVVEQLGAHIENDSVVIYNTEQGWEVTNIHEENQTPNAKHLRQQLQMIVALANHFEPGGPFRTSCFPYKFKLIQNMDAVPEAVRIWLCLLDHCMKDLVQSDTDKMQMLTCFFRSFVSFIASEELQGETLDCLRIITHETLRSMVGKESSCEWHRTSSDAICFEDKSSEVIDNESSMVNDTQATDCLRTDPTDIGKTLESLPVPLESRTSEECLTTSYEKYAAQVNIYLSETVELPREKRIERIVSDVKTKIKPQLVNSWTEELKQTGLPTVLAGLSAVWSLIVSQNTVSTNVSKQLSELQIDCILEFFDNPVDLNRLVYLSSQQGKDLVLGLTAALLALYGHNVLIASYNSNLTRNSSTDLIQVFNSFAIDSNISFGSVEDMAMERSRKDFGEYAAYAYKCLGLEGEAIESEHEADDDSLVLLIDDIDLFLQKKTLGQSLVRYVRPTIPGLAYVGEEKCYTSAKSINYYGAQDPAFCKIKDFVFGSSEFYTLFDGNGSYQIKKFDLIDEYLSRKRVLPKGNAREYRISSKGLLKANYLEEGDYCDSVYFALREADYQQTVDGYRNYGFITIGCIFFPYAHLLKSLPLVLGFVSAPLDVYEMMALKDHYQMDHIISKPFPRPEKTLMFDPEYHFHCVESEYEQDWMMAIMVAINVRIEENCSVLVFFKSEQEMEQFQSSFVGHLEKLSVTVIDTASNRAYITEHEIAVDEVTVLVIEAMRFRGHFAEDRSVHVIQTFWSCDSKEENLIRRQAALWHGSGSYELVILRKELSHLAISEETLVTYELLAKLRGHRYFGNSYHCLNKNSKRYQDFKQFLKTL